MRKLNIGVIDLVTKGPTKTLWARIMHANLASIMPQVVATWCEQAGHEVTLVTYTGLEDIKKEIPKDCDIVFIGAFTQSAQLSYAISNLLRSNNILTVLGGPHARCYPQDAQKYFDYVCGFTNKDIIRDILEDCSPHRPLGLHLAADSQPLDIPGVEERWKFIEPTLKKAPFIKIIPMIGSMGCPYTCSFCIDAVVAYQPLDFDVMKNDLRFVLKKYKRPRVSWHDPNFGIRFNDYMDVIEEAVPPNSIDFIAETSLALLSEDHLKRLKKNGFKAMLPGIESWYDLGNKSRTGKNQGEAKLEKVSDHINMIMDYIPYMQANFVFGLDCDEGPEPFELTKRFIDNAPAAFPGYSLLTAFGQAAPLNLGYQEEGRVLPFPFHFLNNHLAMNVKPKNYNWPEFYDYVLDVTEHSYSWSRIGRRWTNSTNTTTKWMNVVRALSHEGFGRIKYFKKIIKNLESDRSFRDFFEGETTKLPQFYIDIIRKELGNLWEYLPEGAIYHDHLAYLKSQDTIKQERVAGVAAH